jgi:predicted metalloprotease with PDZ domain
MVKYKISKDSLQSNYLILEANFSEINKENPIIKLPTWRPGRYELGNFAKYVQKVSFLNEGNKELLWQKIDTHKWQLLNYEGGELTVKYTFFANLLNAGSTYVDDSLMYVNPINCLFYTDSSLNEKCSLQIEIPEDFTVASAIPFNEDYLADFDNFHTLADSPIIASREIQHKSYPAKDYTYHVWFHGKTRPNWDTLISDFRKFTLEQIYLFGDAPTKEYHFLFLILSNFYYHGVEHLDSTVCCLGPGYKLFKNELYHELLGISSHELFHSWNIKTIRPKEMLPYNYDEENFSRSFYVAEGVTTYYGDYLLYRSGVIEWEQYTQDFNKYLNRHFNDLGWKYESLSESSFNSWLDGYGANVPDKKISFYFKGALITFILDIAIRKYSKQAYSFDDVMRALYNDAKKGEGYTIERIEAIINSLVTLPKEYLLSSLLNSTEPIEALLSEAMHQIGCELRLKPSDFYHERVLGVKISSVNNGSLVQYVEPKSPAQKSGLQIGDDIIAFDGIRYTNITDDIAQLTSLNLIEITYFRNNELHTAYLTPEDKYFNNTYEIVKSPYASESQKEFFNHWSKNNF